MIIIPGYASDELEAQPPSIIMPFSARRSLAALCGGQAAQL